MSRDHDYHPDIRGLVEDALRLDDIPLQALHTALADELSRRDTLRKGLDAGEQLQFDTMIDLVRERTRLGDADALAMIRAHVPQTPPLRGRPRKSP